MAQKIRLGDTVIVITGKHKGKHGIVIKMLKSKNKLIIQGINLVTKHCKPRPELNLPGLIVETEAPLHISNVAIYNKNIGKSDKIIFLRQNKKKIRIFKSDNCKI